MPFEALPPVSLSLWNKKAQAILIIWVIRGLTTAFLKVGPPNLTKSDTGPVSSRPIISVGHSNQRLFEYKQKYYPVTNEQYFRDKIKWYYLENNREFFWRTEILTPFQYLVTELLLKKTRAENAEATIKSFLKLYPDYKFILSAEENEIFDDISILGLGMIRTRALKEIAAHIDENYKNGHIPCNIDQLLEIPHVGMYIANAVMSFAFNKRFEIIDVNSSRVISRFFSIDISGDLRRNKILREKAKKLLPRKGIKEYNWGLLDFAAQVCKPKPLCSGCFMRRKCDKFIS